MFLLQHFDVCGDALEVVLQASVRNLELGLARAARVVRRPLLLVQQHALELCPRLLEHAHLRGLAFLLLAALLELGLVLLHLCRVTQRLRLPLLLQRSVGVLQPLYLGLLLL